VSIIFFEAKIITGSRIKEIMTVRRDFNFTFR